MKTRFGYIPAGLIALAVGLSAQMKSPPGSEAVGVRVPFVGCESDGQMGPQPAPTKADVEVRVDASVAKRLAYYASGFNGVLAPRGWQCFGTYGSNGSSIYVAPRPITSKDAIFSAGRPFTGPAIQLSWSCGGTSGRFSVARRIARVFPAWKPFVQSVIDEGLESASDFPFGPYPQDKLINRSGEIVEYRTPPHAEGLGTMSLLQPGGDPIEGVLIVSIPAPAKDSAPDPQDRPDMLFLAVRLPAPLRDLTPHIIGQLEGDHAVSQPAR